MRQAVLAATVSLLSSEGLSGTTVSAIARAAGVHETSLYRRWKTRENLIYDALATHADEALPVPNTGDVREDLALFFGSVASFLATAEGSALLRLGSDAAMEEGRPAYWEARLRRGEDMVRRGIHRGELAADVDPHLLVEALAGPLFARVLLTGEQVEDDLARRLVDTALDGARHR
ncbi:TetR/AcrR family transcriptional regulator [Streptomyces sp. NPDC057199]|uniref:TetR/AcrR family transcriptional regulator n=1 Tax=Streptomyces sp. NPDC057199 TaxID=3346047 RepID=UPI003631B160